MIVGSLLLILVAVTLLVLGLATGSSVLLVSSIAASLLAAIALVVGARQATTGLVGFGRAGDELSHGAGDEDDDLCRPAAGNLAAGPRRRRATRRERAQAVDEPVRTGVPRQAAYHTGGADAGRSEPAGRAERAGADPGSGFDAEASDEPAPQAVSPAQAAQVARMLSDVLVIDGRPRYHLPGCDHLHGRESEPLPVSEAIELGFTPCARCEPDTALLADARRG